jgi:hypothetical protein
MQEYQNKKQTFADKGGKIKKLLDENYFKRPIWDKNGNWISKSMSKGKPKLPLLKSPSKTGFLF